MDNIIICVFPVGIVETNCYIVYDKAAGNGKCVIIDPGDEAQKICEKFETEGLQPEAVLLTHGHFDHIWAVAGLKEKYPDIKIYASKDEEELLRDPELNASALIRHPMTVEADVLLDDGEVFETAGLSFKNIATPGHTVGSTSFLLENAQKLFCGDTLFENGVGRTDLPTGDRDVLKKSIEKLVKLPDETVCLPGHGRPTTIGREKDIVQYI